MRTWCTMPLIRVLHVDDEPEIGDLTATFLEREDDRFEVQTATSAAEGLDSIRDRPPDCLVSDYDMPGQDGIKFLQRVREECPELPFILFTGKGSEEIASDAISAGVTDYLRKGSGTDQYELLANRITNAVSQVRTEQQLEEERQRFQVLFDRLSQATVEVEYRDDEPIVERVNPAFEDTFGYDADDIVGDSLDTHIVPEDRTDEATQINQCVQDGASLDSEEVTRQSADGPRRFLLQNAVYDDGSGGFAIYTDITGRKEREREVERQNTRLRALFEHFPEPTLTYTYQNGEPRIAAVNGAFVETFDCERETALGEHVDELVVPPDRREEARRIDDRVNAGELIDEELRRQAGDELGDFRLRNIRLPDDENIDGYAVYADITAYKERERELERQNDLFRKAQDIANVGAWEYDTTTDSLTWSAQMCDIHDLPEGTEPTVEKGLDFYHPNDRPIVRDAVRGASENGESYDIEVRLTTANNETRWVRTRGDPQTENGSIARVRGTMQDITERKERERELRRQNERLDEFVSVVSHDLRSPLTVAEGHLELAEEACESPHLARAAEAIDRSQALIEDMLTLARGEDTVGSPEAVSLSALAEECWQVIPGDEATLTVDASRTISADRSRLRQLLENLFANAVEHGGTNTTVRVGDLTDGFYVADDGVGIPDGADDDIFETGDSIAENGTGFGLRVVEQIGDAHGWEIRVTDSDDGGTRFEITGVDIVEEKHQSDSRYL